MDQTEQGSFVVTAEEMRILRQGLFVTLHHGDADIQTITGYDLDDFRQLLWEIAERTGHNDQTRRWLTQQLRELTAVAGLESEQRAHAFGRWSTQPTGTDSKFHRFFAVGANQRPELQARTSAPIDRATCGKSRTAEMDAPLRCR